jgi:hypothetical protein
MANFYYAVVSPVDSGEENFETVDFAVAKFEYDRREHAALTRGYAWNHDLDHEIIEQK